MALAFALAPLATMAQKPDAPVFKINGEVATYGEFDHMFRQNSQTAMTPVSKAEYLQLFINYKLKVAEAHAQHLDTTDSYRTDCKYYIDELAKSYLTDTTADSQLRASLDDRSLWEIKAEHILVQVRPNANPADTAKAYAKIEQARQRILDGESFSNVATSVSEDPSARNNKGDLGYFSTMMMVPEFEDAAYDTPVGSLSPIIRTQFGYHIIHVTDRRPFSGEILLHHILKLVDRSAGPEVEARAHALVDSIYGVLSNGGDFVLLSNQFSDDHSRGGSMPWMSAMNYRMQGLPEFAEQGFALEKGQFSRPFSTQYGWHIVFLTDRRDELSKERKDLMFKRMKQQNPDYAACGTIKKMQQLAGDYKFRWSQAARDSIVCIMTTAANKDERNARLNSLSGTIASLTGKNLVLADLLPHIDKWRANATPNANLRSLRNEMLADFERTQLDSKDADYKFTKREYTEGLLVFEVANSRVWSAEPDSATIAEIYNANPARYSTGGSFDGKIFFCNTVKDAQKISKLVAAGKSSKAEKIAMRVVSGPIRQGDIYDDVLWPNVQPSQYVVVDGQISNGEPLPLQKCRGQIIADYQQRQDRAFSAELRQKYNPQVIMKME